MKCANCGAELNDSAKFCNECGQKVEAIAEAPETNVQENPTAEQVSEEPAPVAPVAEPVPAAESVPAPTKKKSKKLIVIIVSLVVVAAVAVGGFFVVKSLLKKAPSSEAITYNLFNDSLVTVKQGDKYGYMNEAGELAIPAKYDKAREFDNGYAIVEENEKVSLIDTKGEVKLTPAYDGIYDITDYNSLIVYNITENKKDDDTDSDSDTDSENKTYTYSIIDMDGKELTTEKFESIGGSCGSYIEVTQNKKNGYFDLNTNEMVVKPQFDEISDALFDKNIAVVTVGEKSGLIDMKGSIILNPTYDSISMIGGTVDSNSVLFYVTDNEKHGVIDSTGKVIITPSYDDVAYFNDGYFVVEMNDRCGVCDTAGNQIINSSYEYIGSKNNTLINDGLIRYGETRNDESLYGYIDIDNNVVIASQFNEECDFSDGCAIVKVGNNYGVIDTQGKYLINPQYDYIASEYAEAKENDDDDDDDDYSSYYSIECGGKHDYFIICKDGKTGVINLAGDTIIPTTYTSISRFDKDDDSWFICELEGNYGIADETGNFIVPSTYKVINNEWYTNGYIVAYTENKKVTVLNKDLEILTSNEFDAVGDNDVLCSVDDCFNEISYNSTACYTHTCSKSGCYNVVKEGSSYCSDHQYSSYSYSSYYCNWPGCYNRARYAGYCYTHYYSLLNYYY